MLLLWQLAGVAAWCGAGYVWFKAVRSLDAFLHALLNAWISLSVGVGLVAGVGAGVGTAIVVALLWTVVLPQVRVWCGRCVCVCVPCPRTARVHMGCPELCGTHLEWVQWVFQKASGYWHFQRTAAIGAAAHAARVARVAERVAGHAASGPMCTADRSAPITMQSQTYKAGCNKVCRACWRYVAAAARSNELLQHA